MRPGLSSESDQGLGPVTLFCSLFLPSPMALALTEIDLQGKEPPPLGFCSDAEPRRKGDYSQAPLPLAWLWPLISPLTPFFLWADAPFSLSPEETTYRTGEGQGPPQWASSLEHSALRRA